MSRVAVHQLVSEGTTGWYAAGYWKDFQGRKLLCADLGFSFSASTFNAADYQSAISAIDDSTTDVIVEYTFHPGLIQAVKRARPALRVHVRAHNAEALQHWHRGNPTIWPTRRNCYLLYGMARLAAQDRRCALLADSVLGISEWDQLYYWQRIAAQGRFLSLPYFSPWPEIRPQVEPASWDLRQNRIVCMPGGLDRLSRQQRTHFYSLAKALKDEFGSSTPECAITDYVNESFPAPKDVNVLGNLAEPWDLLCQSKAIAVLTDLGFGMKTTILDALAAGCHVLIHKNLLPRLPVTIRDCCIPFDPRNLPRSAELALDAMHAIPEGGMAINSDFRAQALNTLKSLLVETSVNDELAV